MIRCDEIFNLIANLNSEKEYKNKYEWIDDIKKGLGYNQDVLSEGKTKLRIVFENYLKSYNLGTPETKATQYPMVTANPVVGTIYQTAKGPAKWDGKQFTSVQ